MPQSMVTEGHTALATALKNETFHLAWGDLGVSYEDPWTIDDDPPNNLSIIYTESLTRDTAQEFDTLIDQQGILKLISIEDENGQIYVQNTDYYLDTNKVNWSLTGNEPANGVGYTVTYRYFTEHVNTLINELGRIKAAVVEYVYPDDNGAIVDNNLDRWSASETPTRHLRMNFTTEGNEVVDKNIYQLAVFLGTEVDGALPIGQIYFIPSQVTSVGSMYFVENVKPFPLFQGQRVMYDFVITL